MKKNEQELFQAAGDGDIKKLDALIAKGINIDVKNQHGSTPLHYAIRYNNPECVHNLLVAGADKDKQNFFGNAPVHIAASINAVECMRELIEAGAPTRQLKTSGVSRH